MHPFTCHRSTTRYVTLVVLFSVAVALLLGDSLVRHEFLDKLSIIHETVDILESGEQLIHFSIAHFLTQAAHDVTQLSTGHGAVAFFVEHLVDILGQVGIFFNSTYFQALVELVIRARLFGISDGPQNG